MRILILCSLYLVSFGLCAETAFPEDCKVIAVKGDSVALKAKKAKLVLIHNVSSSDLWITHPVKEPSASAGWTTRIQADHWSSLAVDKSPFDIACIESKPGHEQQVPCEGVIALCQWSAVKMPSTHQNTFWASEDQPLRELKAALIARGFILPQDQ